MELEKKAVQRRIEPVFQLQINRFTDALLISKEPIIFLIWLRLDRENRASDSL